MILKRLTILFSIIFLLGYSLAFSALPGGSIKGGVKSGELKGGEQIQQQTQTVNQGEESQIQMEIQQNTQPQEGQTGDQNTEREQNTNQEPSAVNIRKRTRERVRLQIQEHKNTVANFVQTLLQIAEREQGIGEEVRNIAKEQNEANQKVSEALDKIQKRNKIVLFLFGSDYKNLGSLRSEMVKARNRLEQLERLRERIQNEGDKLKLENQIQTLKEEQEKIENFIKEQEGKFSLFGWLLKLFQK